MDKCKFRTCIVEKVFNNAKDATDMILRYAPATTVCNYATIEVGDDKMAVTGDGGTSISGWCGTSNSGKYGTSISGYHGSRK